MDGTGFATVMGASRGPTPEMTLRRLATDAQERIGDPVALASIWQAAQAVGLRGEHFDRVAAECAQTAAAVGAVAARSAQSVTIQNLTGSAPSASPWLAYAKRDDSDRPAIHIRDLRPACGGRTLCNRSQLMPSHTVVSRGAWADATPSLYCFHCGRAAENADVFASALSTDTRVPLIETPAQATVDAATETLLSGADMAEAVTQAKRDERARAVKQVADLFAADPLPVVSHVLGGANKQLLALAKLDNDGLMQVLDGVPWGSLLARSMTFLPDGGRMAGEFGSLFVGELDRLLDAA